MVKMEWKGTTLNVPMWINEVETIMDTDTSIELKWKRLLLYMKGVLDTLYEIQTKDIEISDIWAAVEQLRADAENKKDEQ